MRLHLVGVSFLLLGLITSILGVQAGSAATFYVTNTNDSGAGSLRRAVVDANVDAVVDSIEFAIPAGSCAANGVCTITLGSSLPDITEGVVIDGTTQPRYGTAPSNVCAAYSTPSSMRVLVTTSADHIFNITADGATTIRGLALAGSNTTYAIRVHTNSGTTVQCNHFGTNAPGTGMLELGGGICLSCNAGGGNTVIGTDGDGNGDLAERNVFGRAAWGVNINSGSETYPNRISGNYFGIGADGTTPMNVNYGVYMRQDSTLNLVGSDLDGASDELERNVFANVDRGVWVSSDLGDGDDNKVNGNWFGIDAFGRPGNIWISGIQIDNAGRSHEIRNNQVLWGALGIQVRDGATLAATSGQNCITGNDIGLSHEGTASNLDAEQNFWGASDGPSGIGPGAGDSIVVTGGGSVDFTPWLTSPSAVCVVIMTDGFESGDFSGWSGAQP